MDENTIEQPMRGIIIGLALASIFWTVLAVIVF